ncbi:MAG: hypothetical protein IPH31_19065 [Lewinellaceae bacterium]|nr:hypothetical protein [Lewinellaceae bacterium]
MQWWLPESFFAQCYTAINWAQQFVKIKLAIAASYALASIAVGKVYISV